MKTCFFRLLPGMLVLLAGGCDRNNSAVKSSPSVPVLTARAVEKNVPVLVTPPPVGHVLPVSSVTIRPQIGGIIRQISFREGQAVKSGELLFTLDARPAQAALAAARANLDRDLASLANAKIQFDRAQKLFGQKLISQDEFDTSRSALDALTGSVAADRAAVTTSDLNLQYTEIRSPLDGRTGSLAFHEGNVVKSPDDVLLTINQIHPIQVAFAVPERYLPEIQKQMRSHTLSVTASFENLEGAPPAGELTFVDNAVDAMTGTIQLRATFPNADEKLWPGQFVKLSLQLDELTNAVVVPAQAVQTGQNGQFIYVVKSNPTNAATPTVKERAVTTGITFQNRTVVATGLQAGETVVTDGQLRLVPGVTVSDKSENTATNVMGK